MSLFGTGKNERIDEYFVKENNTISDNDKDNEKSNVEQEEDFEQEENIISDYIDIDDLDLENYESIVDGIENEGWTNISSVSTPITILDKQIVSPKYVEANSYDNILEIICPPEKIITICGYIDMDEDIDDFYDAPNFYQTPHFFTLRCMNNDNVEISPMTIISIIKETRNEKMEKYYQEFYGDLSPITDGKLKKKEDRYYFAETVVLQEGEKLIFRAHYPNIDIAKIDLLMMSDIFSKDE